MFNAGSILKVLGLFNVNAKSTGDALYLKQYPEKRAALPEREPLTIPERFAQSFQKKSVL